MASMDPLEDQVGTGVAGVVANQVTMTPFCV